MKSLLPAVCAALLLIASPAQAQRGALVAPLPQGLESAQILEIARTVLASRGWQVSAAEGNSVLADKSEWRMRVFVENGALTYYDVSRRGGRRSSAFLPVPQAAVDELQGALTAALSAPGGSIAAPPPPPAKVLVGNIPALDPQRLMDAVRAALGTRGWQMLPDEDAAVVAHLRNGDGDAKVKVFLADGALRYFDQSTRRGGTEKAEAPERWIANLRSDIGRALKALPVQQAPAQTKADEPAERLRKLKAMLDAGLITQSEYESKRAEILKGL